mgnify:CR=1 FL=1
MNDERMVETRSRDCRGLCYRDWRECCGVESAHAPVDWGYMWRRRDGMHCIINRLATGKGLTMLQLAIISGLVISLLSLGGGAYMSHRWYRVDALQSELRVTRQQNQRFKKQLGFSQGVDAAAREEEISDEAIVQSILARAPKPTVSPPATDPDCVSAERMLDLGELGKRHKR